MNEISVAAKFSALYGWWNEQLKNDQAYVTALKHLCRANVLAQQRILNVRPRCAFIQSEATEYYHPEEPSCEKLAHFHNERRFLALDLTYGYPVNAVIYEYLLDHGMSREEYHWFAEHRVKARSIMGNDYYVANEHFVKADGSVIQSGEIFGYYVITKQYYERYHLPVMHTETNFKDPERAPGWLRKEWTNMHRLKLEGVPILGFTWYSLTDQMDWDSMLAKDNGTINPLGLVDLDRNIRPVGHAYKKLIEQWRDILPTERFHLSVHY